MIDPQRSCHLIVEDHVSSDPETLLFAVCGFAITRRGAWRHPQHILTYRQARSTCPSCVRYGS